MDEVFNELVRSVVGTRGAIVVVVLVVVLEEI